MLPGFDSSSSFQVEPIDVPALPLSIQAACHPDFVYFSSFTVERIEDPRLRLIVFESLHVPSLEQTWASVFFLFKSQGPPLS